MTEPLLIHEGHVQRDWIDYNGHMRDGYYGVVCSDATDLLMDYLGIDDAYHIQMVMDICGAEALKECTTCGGMAELYPEYAAWYCHACEAWC